jgi:aspartyl-tRNA(Asn)/glutamyl-tRNA(Gln) amidotransferase subunit A
MIDPTTLCLADLKAMLDAGATPLPEIVSCFLDRAKVVQERTNCFIEIQEALAIEQAQKLCVLHPDDSASTMLRGVPYAHKDVFVTPNRQPTAGSRFPGLAETGNCSLALRALRSEGAISLGALSMDEISYGATGLNEHCGHCRNPWDTRFISGGSSSGAAVAVAARAVPFAIGTDTAGSIRIPAALCGVVGLKPTLGRVSTSGTVPLSPSQDTVGVLARTAIDCAWVMDALDKHATVRHGSSFAPLLDQIRALAPRGEPLAGLRIGVCQHPFFDMYDTDGEGVVAESLRTLEQLGAILHDQPLVGIEDYDAAATVITWTEVRSAYVSRLRTESQRFSTAVRMRLEMSLAATPDDYRRAIGHRAMALKEFLTESFAQADVLVCPTVTAPTPMIETLSADAKASVIATTAFLRSNRCFSYLGLPALSVPIGFTGNGLPVGLQLIGKPWAEGMLLQCAAAYQRNADWHSHSPTLAGIGAT